MNLRCNLPHKFVDFGYRHAAGPTIFQCQTDQTRVGIGRLRETIFLALISRRMTQLLLFGRKTCCSWGWWTNEGSRWWRDLLHRWSHGRQNFQGLDSSVEGCCRGTTIQVNLHYDWRVCAEGGRRRMWWSNVRVLCVDGELCDCIVLLLVLHLTVVMYRHHVVRVDHEGGCSSHILEVAVVEGSAVVAQWRVVDADAAVQADAGGPAVVAAKEAGWAQLVIVQFEVKFVQQVEAFHGGVGIGSVATRDLVEFGFDVPVNHFLKREAQRLWVWPCQALEVSQITEWRIHRLIKIHSVWNLGF